MALLFLVGDWSRLILPHQAIVVRKGQTRELHAGQLEMPTAR
jgi:hypothetical protein